MKDALKSALTSIVTFVPRLVGFLLILVIGYFLAKIIGRVIGKLLERVGFDKAVERGGIKKALDRSKFDASDIVGKLVFYTLMLFVLQLAFGVFGPNPISALIASVIAFLPKLLVAIIIIVVAAAIAAAVKTLVEGTLGGLSYGKVLANIASLFILFLGVIAALNQINIASSVTTPILIAVLAIVAGVIIVGAGGGLIKPMQQRWESYLSSAEREAPRLAEHARNAPSVREQATQAVGQARDTYHGADSNNRGDNDASDTGTGSGAYPAEPNTAQYPAVGGQYPAGEGQYSDPYGDDPGSAGQDPTRRR